MTIWESIFLGILQGLTEFLPVSSSGHLLLAEKILGIEQNLFLNVMLHLGTLFAVVIVMRKSIFALFKLKNFQLLYLVIATVPTAALGAVIKLFVPENLLNSLLPIGFALTIVLLLCQHFFSKPKDLPLRDGALPPLIAGIVQAVAVLPGLSRSGSTIATLSFFGIERKKCAEFSFLMSIPVILGASAVEIYQLFSAQASPLTVTLLPNGITPITLLVSITTAFVCAIASLKFMLKIVQNAKLYAFALYLFLPLILSLILL